MNRIGGNDDQDGSDSLVPKRAVKVENYVGIDILHLPEVDYRTTLLAQNRLNAKLFKSPAKGKRLRHLPRSIIQLVHTRKKLRRHSSTESKFFDPISRSSGGHLRAAPFSLKLAPIQEPNDTTTLWRALSTGLNGLAS
jgi:hypothetical protein